ncbi:MAG: hybrid sensor histidine kinase/response regulator [Acidobacteria bacterium]|nr:MAG: hybrid sensor histidine kinase/response regulator [Acidobacteriota bacterium]
MKRTTTRARRRSRRPRADLLGSLYDSIREGVYIGTLDSDDGTTLGANPHLKLMLGVSPEQPDDAVRLFSADRFVDPRARDAFLTQLRRDGAVSDYLLRLRRADDSSIWVEVTATLHLADGTDGSRIDALVRDVSERRKLEDRGRDLSHQLLQAEKMAALGQTVSGVAHELNNPLATILTWAERLAARSVDADTRRGLETILSESERAAKIVRNLLTFARKRNTTRTLVDLNRIVRETLALRAYEQRVSNVTTLEALASGLPHVFADPHQVKQVLLNLIINAEQAMLTANGRGTLVARTWYDDANEMVLIEINDDGPGVPEEVQTKIFEPFFTTKAVGKGTGLGLTVAYAIVQEHGGQLRVASTSESGASFFVSFPAAAAARRPSPPAPAPPVLTAAGSAVLIVEDEPALATAVADALTDAGYRVERAADGEEALKCVEAAVFDLVICDLKMPKLDGSSFYRVLCERKPALARHVIFVTGDVAGTDAERFLTETGCRWLPKPFRLNDLLRAAHEVLS